MISKVIICCCYKGEFFNLPGNVCFMQRTHMKCMCQREQFLYVLFCEEHIYGSQFVSRGFEFEEKCNCTDAGPQEVCNFCFSVRYILNFKCHKLCINNLPEILVDKVVPLDKYLKKIDCDPFFFILVKELV